MKKAFCLLLCFLMLFCCACQKEETKPEPQLSKGTFYTSAGNSYNTHIRLVLITQDLIAPHSSELTFELQNDTDYFLTLITNPSEVALSKWTDGEWKRVERLPTRDEELQEELNIDLERTYFGTPIKPRSTYSYSLARKFSKFPLDAGVYRLCLDISVTDISDESKYTVFPDDEMRNKEICCVADIYFTILPAP